MMWILSSYLQLGSLVSAITPNSFRLLKLCKLHGICEREGQLLAQSIFQTEVIFDK